MGRKGETLRDYIFIDILAHTFSSEAWVKTPLLFSDFIGKCLGKLLCVMNTGVSHYPTLKITGHSFLTPIPVLRIFPGDSSPTTESFTRARLFLAAVFVALVAAEAGNK